MPTHTIDHSHNEASALLSVNNQRLLAALGWSRGFWIASDEKPAHKAVAALGQRRHAAAGEDEPAWEVIRLKGKRTKHSSDEETDDSECFARAGAWIYLFGSQFGSKDGPLQPKRHFVARFNESLVRRKKSKLKAKMDVACSPFVLHRVINDALRQANIDLWPRGPETMHLYIQPALKEADDDEPDWADQVRPWDHPVNVEGATFHPNGRLLLGLRYPITADGHPVIVEIDGIDRLFDKHKGSGRVMSTRVWVLNNVGSKDKPKGVRELDSMGRVIHVITGDLDSDPGRSTLLSDHPEGDKAHSEHWMFELPMDEQLLLEAEAAKRPNKDADNAEGLALLENGEVWYAHDAENIRLGCYESEKLGIRL